jgi:hypothetical protein
MLAEEAQNYLQGDKQVVEFGRCGNELQTCVFRKTKPQNRCRVVDDLFQ